MNKIFHDKAWYEYLYWQDQDRKTLRRINELINDIDKNGALRGIGKPELLKGRKDISRRIDEANRLIYLVIGDEIIVLACKGHYED